MKNLVLLLVMFVSLAGTSFAQQKYGHCNFRSLVSAMPGTQQADTELEAYQKQLVKKGEDMASDFQTKVAQFYKDQQSGEFPPKALSEREQALQKEQQAILGYEQEIGQLMGTKREELLTPLATKVSDAIKKIAKDNGFTMIFDTSVFNAVLFGEDSLDITDLVKAELGIQ